MVEARETPFPTEIIDRAEKRFLKTLSEKIIPKIRETGPAILADAFWAFGLKKGFDINQDRAPIGKPVPFSATEYLRFCLSILHTELEKLMYQELSNFIILSEDNVPTLPNGFSKNVQSANYDSAFNSDFFDDSYTLTPMALLTFISAPLGMGYGISAGLAAGILGGISGAIIGLVAAPIALAGLTFVTVASEYAILKEPYKRIETEALNTMLTVLSGKKIQPIVRNIISQMLKKVARDTEMNRTKQLNILCSSMVQFTKETSFEKWKVAKVKFDENSVSGEKVTYNVTVVYKDQLFTTNHRFANFRQIYEKLCKKFPEKILAMNLFPWRTLITRKDVGFLESRAKSLMSWIQQCESDEILSESEILREFLGIDDKPKS